MDVTGFRPNSPSRTRSRNIGARAQVPKSMQSYRPSKLGVTILATDILLPKLGFSMNEGILNEWLFEDGAQVEAGQTLYLLESDKSVNEVESPASGRLAIIAQPGETYEVGTVLGRIE
jgi:multidrug efflux pump subunit AcrA (membrane-fusion protein)